MEKARYLIHKKNGSVERLRGEEISRLIGKKYPFSAQIALVMDKDTKPEEYAEYQKFREECKAQVDAQLLLLSSEAKK